MTWGRLVEAIYFPEFSLNRELIYRGWQINIHSAQIKTIFLKIISNILCIIIYKVVIVIWEIAIEIININNKLQAKELIFPLYKS